jgi:predicted nuclease of predicted toxin-antitoxin system
MNLSPTWVSFLIGAGFESVHWSEMGNPRAPDRELMAWAREGGYIVFTHDLDFSILIATTGAIGPSVLQVRTLNLLPSVIGADVVGVLHQYAEELDRGAIVSLDGASSRVRILPIRRRTEGPG